MIGLCGQVLVAHYVTSLYFLMDFGDCQLFKESPLRFSHFSWQRKNRENMENVNPFAFSSKQTCLGLQVTNIFRLHVNFNVMYLSMSVLCPKRLPLKEADILLGFVMVAKVGIIC
jgi:hypothetical protein